MAPVATWQQKNLVGGVGATGGAFTPQSITIPVGARLVRVIVWGQAAGVQVSTAGPLQVCPTYLNYVLTLEGGNYGTRTLYEGRRLLNFSAATMYDPSQAAGSRAINYMYHGGATAELGCDLQMSYGDATHIAGTVTFNGGFYTMVTGATNFNIYRTLVMKTLHYK